MGKKIEVKKPGKIKKLDTRADDKAKAIAPAKTLVNTSSIGMDHGKTIKDFLAQAKEACDTFSYPGVQGIASSELVQGVPMPPQFSGYDITSLHNKGIITDAEIRIMLGLSPTKMFRDISEVPNDEPANDPTDEVDDGQDEVDEQQ